MALTKVTGQVIKNTTDVTVGVLTVTSTLAVGGTVSIGGTLTYEDVTNVDSVGLITARNGILVGSGITLSKDGDIFATGVSTYSGLADFNGGINVLSNVTISDSIVHDGDTDTKIRFPEADHISMETGGNERARIKGNGNIGIGTIDPNNRFHVYGGQIKAQTSTDDTNTNVDLLRAQCGSNGNALFSVRAADAADNNSDWDIKTNANEDLSFTIGGSTEKARINSDGKITIGSTAIRTIGGDSASSHLQVEGITANTSSFALINNQANSNSPVFSFGKSRGTSVGASDVVTSGDFLGEIEFCGADGTDLHNATAQIKAVVNGTVSGNTVPTDLIFETSPSNNSNRTERIRIQSDGHVGIGTDVADTPLHVHDSITNGVALFESGDAYCNIVFQDSSTNSSYKPQFGVQGNDFRFVSYDGSSAASEKLRIHESGQVGIGTNQEFGATNNIKFLVDGEMALRYTSKGDGQITQMASYGKAMTMTTSAVDVLRFHSFGSGGVEITVFRRDSTNPSGGSVTKLYIAFQGSGNNITNATLVQEDKVTRGSIHAFTYSISDNNTYATLTATGNDNGGEAQTLIFYVVHSGGNNRTISVL